jgi:hypothetical protein
MGSSELLTEQDARPFIPFLNFALKRDSDTRFSTLGFLRGSVSPKPIIIPLESFQIL